MSRTIRIFISSTFQRFDQARNILVGRVFPVIQELCRENGFSFRAVDLRWGITDDEGRNHQVADICFEEIRRCQAYSPAPNFIVLSDDYYGWIPLPASISAFCWAQLEEYLAIKDPAGLAVLKKWYRRDWNDISGHYILQEKIREPEPDADSPAALNEETEARLGDILFPAAQEVFADDYSLRVAFGGSLTEQEINLGLFSSTDAGRHTLVMIRDAGKEEVEPAADSGFNARNLNKHLKQVAEAKGNAGWISLCEETFQQDALEFLEKVVREQIRKVKEEESGLSSFDLEYRAVQEALSAEVQDYVDAGNRLEHLQTFIGEHTGIVSVVTGKQGSGKSTLLEYYAWSHPDHCVGVFTDLQGNRETVESVLTYLTESLYHRGLLKRILHREPGESFAGLFERQMAEVNTETEITLIIDCLEQIADYPLQEESLFSIVLPEKVSLLVSCIGKSSLTQTDLLYSPPVFEIGNMPKTEGLDLLLHILHGYGRTLSSAQLESLRRAMPETAVPLYLRHLADILRKVRSHGADDVNSPGGHAALAGEGGAWSAIFDRPLPETTFLLIRQSLELEMQAYLPGLFRFALACIALSTQGLQEEELIDLMLQNMEDSSSVRAELLKNSHWAIMDMEHVLNIFWSRMYFQLQHYLRTYESGGNLLIRFRHGLMKKAALETAGHPETCPAAGSRTGAPGLLESVSRHMRDYWLEQPVYLALAGPVEQFDPVGPDKQETSPVLFEEDRMIVNRRRADELLPVLAHRKEYKKIGEILEDPYALDAMVRLDRCAALMDLLDRALKEGYAGSHAAPFRELLERNEILLTSFQNSFLPLCVQAGIAEPGILRKVGLPGYFAPEKDMMTEKTDRAAGDCAGREAAPQGIFSDLPKDLSIHIPGCADAPMALRSDGVMAVMDRGNIRIYDWKRRRYSQASVPMRTRRFDFLVWNGDQLILRRAKTRITFLYQKKPGGAGEQLQPVKQETCPNLLDLFADEEEKRRRAGSIQEEDAASVRTSRQMSYHTQAGIRRQRTLEYPLEKSIEYYLRLNRSAIVKDREEIDFADLETGMIHERIRIPNVTGVFFSEDGTAALLRTREDTVILHLIPDTDFAPMPDWGEAPSKSRGKLRRYHFSRMFSPAILFSPRRKRDIPWQPPGTPMEGTTSPILTCLSVRGGWYASYYYYNNLALVSVFDLRTGTEILSSEVEPVYRRDMELQPFRPDASGGKLLLRSSGDLHVLDLTKEMPSWKNQRKIPGEAAAELQRGILAYLQQKMWRWIRGGYEYETLDELTDNSFDTFAGKLGFRLWRFVFFPLTYALMIEKSNNTERKLHPHIMQTRNFLWAVDPMSGTVHIADQAGKWLCHTQVKESFAACDVMDNRLYLMDQDGKRVLCIRYNAV